MNSPTHDQIAQRAHQLWLEQGCPEGRHDEHWRAAAESFKAPPASREQAPKAPAHSSGATTLSAVNNDIANQSAKPNLKAVAAAESAEENLMSPAPSDDAAIQAALPSKEKRGADKPAVLTAANQPPDAKSKSRSARAPA